MAVISEIVTDRALISFDTLSPPRIENVNGENYFRIIGTIDNFQDLEDAHGQFVSFRNYNFQYDDINNDQIYNKTQVFNVNTINNNLSGENFDFSIKIPDHLPNGNYEHESLYLDFDNQWISAEFIDNNSTLNYFKQQNGDTTNPVLTINSFETGYNSYPSYVISGSVTDDIAVDYVHFNIVTTDNQQNQSMGISSEAIAEDGSFSFEYVPHKWLWDEGSGEMVLRGAFAMDTSGNESDLYASDPDGFAPYYVFSEEPEIYAENPYEWNSGNDLFFFLDRADIATYYEESEVINLDGSPGAYANFSNNEITYNGVTVPSNTILNVDGTTYQIPAEFSGKNSYDYDVEIFSTFGNDYVNVEDINNKHLNKKKKKITKLKQ
jgi:hypothetical protein